MKIIVYITKENRERQWNRRLTHFKTNYFGDHLSFTDKKYRTLRKSCFWGKSCRFRHIDYTYIIVYPLSPSVNKVVVMSHVSPSRPITGLPSLIVIQTQSSLVSVIERVFTDGFHFFYDRLTIITEVTTVTVLSIQADNQDVGRRA